MTQEGEQVAGEVEGSLRFLVPDEGLHWREWWRKERDENRLSGQLLHTMQCNSRAAALDWKIPLQSLSSSTTFLKRY